MRRKKTVRDFGLQGKRVLVRVDYNEPLSPESGELLGDTRIKATLPTIRYLQEQGARIILCSHLGRPKGRDLKLSLRPVGRRLSELLGQPVRMSECCTGPATREAALSLQPGDLLLLENLRFHPEEEANEAAYARELASLAEVFVNDAFGTAHRAHASTAGVTAYLPAVAGFLMEKEIEYLGRAVSNPERPYAAVIGGAKVSSKMPILQALLQRVDKLLIGGGMANTFLKATGVEVGQSWVENEFLEQARQILKDANEKGVELLLPLDVVVAERFAGDSPLKTVGVNETPAEWRIMDVGEATMEGFAAALRDCRTIFWNGPLGVIEFPAFATGSRRLAQVIAALTGATTIIGGGETAEVVDETGLESSFTHVSTGGGASLEFIEGRELPGIASLLDAEAR